MAAEVTGAMKLLCLSAGDLRRALPMTDTVAAMKRAYAAHSAGSATMAPRGVIPADGGTTLVMGGYVPALGLAAKIVSVFPRNRDRGKDAVCGLVVVLDPDTGEPAAVCDGTFLTAWRTGAASGAATDLLARRDARVGAVIGCGGQARTQVLAIDAVRQLEVIRVHGRSPRARQSFVATMQSQLGARLQEADTAARAVGGADVVCTATTATEPVIAGQDLSPGSHINAVGSFRLDMREIDCDTIGRARVFVDSVGDVVAEAGDLVYAEDQGKTRREDWIELGAVVAGEAAGRRDDREVTLFKSVGLAVQDVASATLALERARERGLGQEIEL